MLRVANLSFSYDTKLGPVFADLSFAVEKNQIFCILGPNGCGKSTLLQTLIKVIKPLAGSIQLEGVNIEELSQREIARKVAYIPQVHAKSFPYKVIDIVLMGRAAHTGLSGEPKAKDYQIALEALDLVGMSRYRDTPYTQLSGGETQLVMVARALAQETEIIIMDEPTAHLDFQHEIKLLEILSELTKSQKLTIIMATHFPNHAFYLENQGLKVQAALMYDHKIRESGPAEQVITRENIEKVFKIEALLINDIYEGRKIKQIVALNSKAEGGENN